MKSLIVSPVARSTVATVRRGPPRPNAALILFMPWPGMNTHESRGRLTTVTLDRSSAIWISIRVSELELGTSPTCSTRCWAGVRPARRSTPASSTLSGPLRPPAVPAKMRPTAPLA